MYSEHNTQTPSTSRPNLFGVITTPSGTCLAVAEMDEKGEWPRRFINLFQDPGRRDGAYLAPFPQKAAKIGILVYNPGPDTIMVPASVEGESYVEGDRDPFDPDHARGWIVQPCISNHGPCGTISQKMSAEMDQGRPFVLQPIGYDTTMAEVSGNLSKRGLIEVYERRGAVPEVPKVFQQSMVTKSPQGSGSWRGDSMLGGNGSVAVGIGLGPQQAVQSRKVDFDDPHVAVFLAKIWVVAQCDNLRQYMSGHLGTERWDWYHNAPRSAWWTSTNPVIARPVVGNVPVAGGWRDRG